MCGILGCCLKMDQVDSEALKKSVLTLSHRGPNAQGSFISKNGRVGFGHTRLSFLDLSDQGNQPMTDKTKGITVVLNGEIYNYIEVRDELMKLGYQFHTKTDTEVLIHGYNEWKELLPSKLDGMFAFAIYNEPDNTIFLARDRFGIKPLYYYHDTEKFAFGSEIKAILSFNIIPKKVNQTSVSLFLANRYVPSPHTIWEGILKISPGSSLTLNLHSFKVIKSQYWKLQYENIIISEQEALEKFNLLLLNSMEKNLRSDVPIGSFLSGGYDSSSLVYIMSKKLNYPTKAFSIGFENWNESEDQFAKMVAEATGTTLHTTKPQSINLETTKTLMWHYDDPIADISIIPTYEVSNLASRYVKAVVSGEGADEILAGYWWHKPDKFSHKTYLQKILSTIHLPTFKNIKHHYINAMSMGLFDSIELKKALTSKYHASIPHDPFGHFDQFKLENTPVVKQIQYMDIYNFMSELVLTKVDRASMANSLEVRVPFLDHHLFEFVFSLSPDVYTKPGIQKYFLRNLLEGNVPDTILQRGKQGFVGPDKYYMNFRVYESALINGRLVQDDVIKQNYIHEKLKNKDHWRLWKLFVLENWWQTWM